MGKYYLVAVPFAGTLPQHYSVAVHAESEELQDVSEYSVLDVAVRVFVGLFRVFFVPAPEVQRSFAPFRCAGCVVQ